MRLFKCAVLEQFDAAPGERSFAVIISEIAGSRDRTRVPASLTRSCDCRSQRACQSALISYRDASCAAAGFD
jgi:hypothetical protein